MNLFENAIYKSDLEKCVKNLFEENCFENTTFLITGATGLVCSAIIDLLLSFDGNITVYAAGRNKDKVLNRFGSRVKFIYYDATKSVDLDIAVDYVIHGASNSSPDLYMSEPVETMQANINGIQNLLDYSIKKGVKKVIYISSSEVYGIKDTLEPFKEDQYGYIDVLDIRSSYSIAKRAAETICISYKSEYDVDFNIVRLGHIYGPSISNLDKRVSSDFAMKSANNQPLILKSEGREIRSYCYSLDCASAILFVLIKGQTGEAYNISNPSSILSIREMAQYLANAGNVELIFDLPSKIEKLAFNPMYNSSLNSNKLESLGWRAQFDAKEGLSHTVKILKELFNN